MEENFETERRRENLLGLVGWGLHMMFPRRRRRASRRSAATRNKAQREDQRAALHHGCPGPHVTAASPSCEIHVSAASQLPPCCSSKEVGRAEAGEEVCEGAGVSAVSRGGRSARSARSARGAFHPQAALV